MQQVVAPGQNRDTDGRIVTTSERQLMMVGME